MHIHILGICGTFMGGLALLARELGYTVSGSDSNVYPPMSTQLEAHGIKLLEGYRPEHLSTVPDLVIVGNALSRGNPLVELLLNAKMPYTSGPQWLADTVLRDKHVLAVAGTHGKTTTASMLAWTLDHCGLEPGFLIGGVAANFGVSARIGGGRYFVVEADEYDTAFFDKRSKFVHYQPDTLVINNLEFDHADIFPDLEAIKRQFQHLLRTVPGNGRIIYRSGETDISDVLAAGCWTEAVSFGLDDEAGWRCQPLSDDARDFAVWNPAGISTHANSKMIGEHNALNATAAIAAAEHVGISPTAGAAALTEFEGVKRRLELIAEINGIRLYDDFAHHPTAVAETLRALRARASDARIIAVLEPRSNTMRLGVHKDALESALRAADLSLLLQPAGLSWDLSDATQALGAKREVFDNVDAIISRVIKMARSGDEIVIMSNGAFGGIHQRLVASLGGAASAPAQ